MKAFKCPICSYQRQGRQHNKNIDMLKSIHLYNSLMTDLWKRQYNINHKVKTNRREKAEQKKFQFCKKLKNNKQQ